MLKKKPLITVVGSYAVGMTMRANRFPTCGETLIGRDFKQLHGGKGSNQAVESARLGANINFIACLGKDALAEKALQLYKEEGVDTQHIKYSESFSTGVGFIMVDNEGNNIILLDFGANNDLMPEYVESKSEIITNSDIVLVQLEIPVETVVKTVEIAKRNNTKVILNPAPYQHIHDKVWKGVTIATPNEKESKLILGYSPDEKVKVEELAKGLLAKGVENVVITLGEKGCYVATEQDEELIPANRTNVIDTTGAGDTFTAALGVAIAEGSKIKEAVRFASAAAAVSVSKYGVIEAMPYRNEVESAMVLD